MKPTNYKTSIILFLSFQNPVGVGWNGLKKGWVSETEVA